MSRGYLRQYRLSARNRTWFVCDCALRVIDTLPSLTLAKVNALLRKTDSPSSIFFVCDQRGLIVAGY